MMINKYLKGYKYLLLKMDELIYKIRENNIKINVQNVDLIIYVIKEIENNIQDMIKNKIYEITDEKKLKSLVAMKTLEYEEKDNKNIDEIKILKSDRISLENDIENFKKKLDGSEDKHTKDLIEKENFLNKNFDKIISIKDEQLKDKDKDNKKLHENFEKNHKLFEGFYNKQNSKKANDRGDIGENNIYYICKKPLVYTKHGSEKSKCGDAYIYNPENDKIKIMVESKNYAQNTYLGPKEIEKFKRDLEQDNNCDVGIFLCWNKQFNYEGIEHNEVKKYNGKYALYLLGDKANINNTELQNFVVMFYKLAEILYHNKHKDFNNLENKWEICVDKIKEKMFETDEINKSFKKSIDILEKTTKDLRTTYNKNKNLYDFINIIIKENFLKEEEEVEYVCNGECGFKGTYDKVVKHELICGT